MAVDPRAALERTRRSIEQAVSTLSRLHEERFGLAQRAQQALAKHDEAASRLLEELRYQVRREARYLRLLQRHAQHVREEHTRARARLLSLATDAPAHARVLQLFGRIEMLANTVIDHLTTAGEHLGREASLLGTSEGRGWFSTHVNLSAYQDFLRAWEAELDVERRLADLRSQAADCERDLAATEAALSPQGPLRDVTSAAGMTLVALLVGHTVLALLTAIMAGKAFVTAVARIAYLKAAREQLSR